MANIAIREDKIFNKHEGISSDISNFFAAKGSFV